MLLSSLFSLLNLYTDKVQGNMSHYVKFILYEINDDDDDDD